MLRHLLLDTAGFGNSAQLKTSSIILLTDDLYAPVPALSSAKYNHLQLEVYPSRIMAVLAPEGDDVRS